MKLYKANRKQVWIDTFVVLLLIAFFVGMGLAIGFNIYGVLSGGQ